MKKIIIFFAFFFAVEISVGDDAADVFSDNINESITDIVADSKDLKRIFNGEQRLQSICDRLGNPDYFDERRKAEAQLIAALKDVKNVAAYPWIARQLGRIGSADSVPALVEKLNTSTTEAKNYARFDLFDEIVAALAMIPDKEAGDHIRKILATVPNPNKKIALIQALAYRNEPESVEAISEMLFAVNEIKKSAIAEQQAEIANKLIKERLDRIKKNLPEDPKLEQQLKKVYDIESEFSQPHPLQQLSTEKRVMYFAIQSLGKIGDKNAAESLERLNKDTTEAWMCSDALISCSNNLVQSGNLAQAISIFQDLSLSRNVFGTRCAANRGMLRISTRSDDLSFLVFLLKAGPDRKEVLQAALGFLWEMENKLDGKITEKDFKSLSPDIKIAVLNIFGQKRDQTMLGLIQSVISNPAENETLQAAAYGALGGAGNKDSVPQLLEKLNSNGLIADAVCIALNRSVIEGLDEAIAAAAGKTNNSVAKNNLLTVASERKCRLYFPMFLEILFSANDQSTRDIAVQSIGEIGSIDDVAKICDAILRTPKGEKRIDLERAAQKICERNPDREQRTVPILQLYKKSDEKTRPALYGLLARLGGKHAFETTLEGMKSTDALTKETAFQALCNWSDMYAADELYRLATRLVNKTLAQAALRSYMRIITLPSDRSGAESVELFEKAMQASSTVEEHNYLLGRAGSAKSLDVLNFIIPYVDKPENRDSAFRAVLDMARDRDFHLKNRSIIDPVLEQIKRTAGSREASDSAKEFLER